LILIIAVILVLLFLLRDRSPFGKSNVSFSVDREKEITRIEFDDGTRQLTLKKKGEEWLVNQKAAARKSSISFIISVLNEITIKSPVSEEMFNEEILNKGIEPVRVRVYMKNRLVKSFYVYKTGSNIYGNIMRTRERSKPFIVYVPAYEGDIGSAFTLNELYWQPYTVFDLMPSSIGSVTLENLRDSSSSFSIKKNGSRYTLADVNGEITGWDTTSVARYLSYFIRVPFEGWAFEETSPPMAVTRPGDPLYRIILSGTDGSGKTLTVVERVIMENGNERIDSDRVFGMTEESDEMFIMRYFDIDPVLKKKSYFFPD
ncbi:MAG TPA: hypothetical protein VK861_00670, partial [Bacteroidales bacterium]|nr:hypothetical protein [Bacteroidales bacterium]